MATKKPRNIGLYIALLVLLILAMSVLYTMRPTSQMRYSEVLNLFETQQVTDYTLDFGTGELTLKVAGQESPIIYKVANVGVFLDDIKEHVAAYNEAHPDAKMTFDQIPATEIPWWLSMLPLSLIHI